MKLMMKLILNLLLLSSISCAAWASAEKVQFSTSDEVLLHAQLYTHGQPKKKIPGVLIVDGSLKPYAAFDTQPNPVAQLAERLAEEGFAVLTFHKRGCRDNAQVGSYWKSSFSQDQDDTQAAFNYLKSHSQVISDKIYVLGYGIGGTHALKLAEKNSLAGVIMLASTIRYIGDLQLEQAKLSLTLQDQETPKIETQIKTLSQQIQDVKSGNFKCQSPGCEQVDETPVFEKSMAVSWWTEVLKLDFTDWALKSPAPILFVFGTSDFVIPETDYHYVQDVIRLHKTSHIEVVRLKNVDHFLAESESLKSSFQYSLQLQKDKKFKSLSPALATEVTNWLKRLPESRKQARKQSRGQKSFSL